MRKRLFALILAALAALAALMLASGASAAAQEVTDSGNQSRLEKRLLRASAGVQYPGSESDSTWRFVSYPDEEELPDAARFEEISGCPVTEYGGTNREDFEATFDRLTRVEPWMDEGQVRSAKGFQKIERIILKSYGERALYRCQTSEYGQVYIYFVGLDDDGISGLLTVSTET